MFKHLLFKFAYALELKSTSSWHSWVLPSAAWNRSGLSPFTHCSFPRARVLCTLAVSLWGQTWSWLHGMDALWPGDYREAGVRAHGSPGYSSREVGQERNTQTESWVWRWETKSESFLLGISVFHQHPQGVRAQWPFGAFQTFTWAALLSGMPALHRSEVYPSAASELKGWGPGTWTAGRDEPLGNRPAFHSSLQWLTVLGALRLLLLLDVRRCPESSQGTGGTSR